MESFSLSKSLEQLKPFWPFSSVLIPIVTAYGRMSLKYGNTIDQTLYLFFIFENQNAFYIICQGLLFGVNDGLF